MLFGTALILFVLLVAIISYVGYRGYVKPSGLYRRLIRTKSDEGESEASLPEPQKLPFQMLQAIGNASPMFEPGGSPTHRELVQAGFRSDKALALFAGVRLAACVVPALAAFVYRFAISGAFQSTLLLGAAAAGFGYMAPGIVLERLVKRRQKRLRLSLPDALDLMVVSVEAGLGLDQAIYYTAKELSGAHKEICEELSLISLQIRAGTKRSDAFRNLAERTGEGELRKLISMLIQTDRFGTSIADSLRGHSEYMRVRRRQDAEERAAKVGVKLVFPIFFCILPSMMLVSAGPGILQICKSLLPMLKSFGQQ
jgi:tight adherence protein C